MPLVNARVLVMRHSFEGNDFSPSLAAKSESYVHIRGAERFWLLRRCRRLRRGWSGRAFRSVPARRASAALHHAKLYARHPAGFR